MSTYNNLADFSSEGFGIGKDNKVMTYLHGLSDFWVYMFDDASKVNMMMEANAITASDIYNKFLQLTSVISLDGISTLTNSQLKLILISEEAKVTGKVETYTIPKETDLKYARCLVNRAFLPTATLENEADYYIDESLGQISFAQPLADLGFPFRTLASGKKEYAVWAIDAKIDNQLIYEYYAKLINVNPSASTELFKNFVYGMYYLFVQGPNLETVRQGLNIALGIPLARDIETVLEVRKYLNTDQWIVITDLNSYIIPYGLDPSVEVDDVLAVGQDLASWIEVKDYINDGEWWINFMIPSHLMPHVPTSVPGGDGVNADAVPDRYMIEGSYADYIMRNFLKTHTFLVNVKTLGFKNIQSFQELYQIIKEVKPSYTTPIYVWTVPITEDILTLVEENTFRVDVLDCEELTDGMNRFYRGNTTDPLIRDCCPGFIRMSVPHKLDDQTGMAQDLNGFDRSFQDGNLTGFIAPQRTYRDLSGEEEGWNRALRSRHNDQYLPKKGLLDFSRNHTKTGDGTPVNMAHAIYPGYRLVALHTTTLADVTEKFTAFGYPVPPDYIFSLLEPTFNSDLINEHAIGDLEENHFFAILMQNFDYLFGRGANGKYLGPLFPDVSYDQYFPPASAITESDFLVFSRINEKICGVFWATKNFTLDVTPYDRHGEADPLTIRTEGLASRGGAPMGSAMYMTRSAGSVISYNTLNPASPNITVMYEDANNAPIIRTRGGTNLITNRVFK